MMHYLNRQKGALKLVGSMINNLSLKHIQLLNISKTLILNLRKQIYLP